MAGKTDYGKLNAEIEKKKEAKERRGKFSEIKWMKIPYGDTNLGMLPPFSDDHDLYFEVYLHFGFKDSKDNKRSYRCSRVLHKECPICESAEKMKDSDPKRYSEIKSVKQYLYNVYDTEFANRVAILKPTQHNEVIQELNSYHIDEGVDATDPAEGKLLKLSRMKAQPYARARIAGKVKTLPEGKAAELLAGMTDLTKAYINNTPQDLYKMMQGEDINVKEEKSSETSVESKETKAETAPSNGTATKSEPAVANTTTQSKPAPAPELEAKADAESSGTGDPELDEIMNMLD